MHSPLPLYASLLPFAASIVAIAVTALLFVTIKVELRRDLRREQRRLDLIEASLETSLEPRPAPAEPIDRRAHVLQLLRSGQDPAHIATVLEIPRREVELAARVQALIPR